MATINELAKKTGLKEVEVKVLAGLPPSIASGKELTNDEVLKVLSGMHTRTSDIHDELFPPAESEASAAPADTEAPVAIDESNVVQHIDTIAVDKIEKPESGQETDPVPPKPKQTTPPRSPAKFPWWAVIVVVPLALVIAFLAGALLFGPRVGQISKTDETKVPATTEAPAASAPAATEAPAAPAATEAPADELTAPADGKALAEKAWGESLPDVPELYSAHAGEDGYPDICAGLCWDTSKIGNGVMMWYGPNAGEEDITESDRDFGDGSTGPLELMRTGKITKVIFFNGKEAQLEVCAVGSLDGKPLTDVLGIKKGACGDRVAIAAGWHVIENNANTPIAGFGVRLTASGWAGMTESQIVQYTKYWKVEGTTATWVGPADVEVMMTPAMVSMMQDFGTLKTVVFTTTTEGSVLFCNGTVTGSASLSSPDGSCQMFDVPSGTLEYHGEDRLSAGISWQSK